MKNFLKKLYFSFRFRGKNVRLSKGVNILKDSYFEGNNIIGENSKFQGHLGLCSYIGPNCDIYGCKIGRFTSISYGVEVITGVHTYKSPYVSTCPLFVSTLNQTGITFVEENVIDEFKYADSDRKYYICIGNDCWLGYKCSIINGVTIGDGAVVLSKAVVTKDVPPYAIVGGIPAKIIGYRYEKDIIDILMSIKWWDWPLNKIHNNRTLFLDLSKFIEMHYHTSKDNA